MQAASSLFNLRTLSSFALYFLSCGVHRSSSFSTQNCRPAHSWRVLRQLLLLRTLSRTSTALELVPKEEEGASSFKSALCQARGYPRQTETGCKLGCKSGISFNNLIYRMCPAGDDTRSEKKKLPTNHKVPCNSTTAWQHTYPRAACMRKEKDQRLALRWLAMRWALCASTDTSSVCERYRGGKGWCSRQARDGADHIGHSLSADDTLPELLNTHVVLEAGHSLMQHQFELLCMGATS